LLSSEDDLMQSINLDERSLKTKELIYYRYTSKECEYYRKKFLIVCPISKPVVESFSSDSSVEPIRYAAKASKRLSKIQECSSGEWNDVEREDLLEFEEIHDTPHDGSLSGKSPIASIRNQTPEEPSNIKCSLFGFGGKTSKLFGSLSRKVSTVFSTTPRKPEEEEKIETDPTEFKEQ